MDIYSVSLNFVLFICLGIFLIEICTSACRQNSTSDSHSDGELFIQLCSYRNFCFLPVNSYLRVYLLTSGIGVGHWWLGGGLDLCCPPSPLSFFQPQCCQKHLQTSLLISELFHCPLLFRFTTPFLPMPYCAAAGGKRLFVKVGCSFEYN